MKRRLFTILCALSFLLFAAVCVLAVRRYWRSDTLIVLLAPTFDGDFVVVREWQAWSGEDGFGARYRWSQEELTSIDQKGLLDWWDDRHGAFLDSDKPDSVPDFPDAGPTHRYGIAWRGESGIGYYMRTLMVPPLAGCCGRFGPADDVDHFKFATPEACEVRLLPRLPLRPPRHATSHTTIAKEMFRMTHTLPHPPNQL